MEANIFKCSTILEDNLQFGSYFCIIVFAEIWLAKKHEWSDDQTGCKHTNSITRLSLFSQVKLKVILPSLHRKTVKLLNSKVTGLDPYWIWLAIYYIFVIVNKSDENTKMCVLVELPVLSLSVILRPFTSETSFLVKTGPIHHTEKNIKYSREKYGI